ncbi:MAG: undecaprenyl/decaprenyl-phosphate alpha-N-acetylglucosaminyl 1-phosphate transferase, partial [Firmicutes bacterium]|nr:undecaprenyl/decaprenyl-phosphate alpha-N-acetylglucosaminyl 1-phosphate transferase [Bacillota bacterium]
MIILFSAVVAFVAVRWCYFKVLRIAKARGIVDRPDARKLQKHPVPVLGGIAVFFGLVVGVLAGASLNRLLSGQPPVFLAPPLCAMIVMIYVGSMDDVVGLSPFVRFMAEILTIICLIFASNSCVDSLHGLWGIDRFSWWIAIPLTIFAGVGIINAVNMIDGVNGLCSGMCLISCCMFGYAFIRVEDMPNAILSFAMVAALIPFFLHNVFGKKSKMFLGDAGTMMIGMMMVWFTIVFLSANSSVRLLAAHKNLSMIAMVLAILSVPVFDTVRVMTQRIYHGYSPFHPDKTHLHHVFIRAGVSHSVTTLIEIFVNLLIVGIWALSAKLHCGIDVQLYIVVLVSIILVWGLYFFIARHERKHTAFMHRLARFGIKSHLGHTETWIKLESMLDAPLGETKEE